MVLLNFGAMASCIFHGYGSKDPHSNRAICCYRAGRCAAGQPPQQGGAPRGPALLARAGGAPAGHDRRGDGAARLQGALSLYATLPSSSSFFCDAVTSRTRAAAVRWCTTTPMEGGKQAELDPVVPIASWYGHARSRVLQAVVLPPTVPLSAQPMGRCTQAGMPGCTKQFLSV